LISGITLKNAIISGYNKLSDYRQSVDELNVFPVPDGDTGTNMTMTMSAAAAALEKLPDTVTAGETAQTAASALLRGARGNSGVITSLLFRGIAKGLENKESVTPVEFSTAIALGVEYAYKAVMKPTEGTMLTVARVASERAAISCVKSCTDAELFDAIVTGAEESLATTPDLLPVLKKAGVVDAGGKGVLLIFEGMRSVIKDGIVYEQTGAIVEANTNDSLSKANEYEGEITFTYCTEFIAERSEKSKADPLKLREFLEGIGDSAVVVDDEEIVKVHVHTDNPGKALQEGLKFGQLISVKIENMREQQRILIEERTQKALAPVEPEEGIGFVAVASGEGLCELFKELGCTHVVSGGQTMNPSTDDILEAILATPAKTVFVLPNNKNIIMAAEQTVSLADRKVIVLKTKTIPQGVCAMLAYDPDMDASENFDTMTEAFSSVSSGAITYAARDSEFGGLKIKENDILAMDNGKIEFVEHDPVKACARLVKHMYKKNHTFITIFYGEDITDEQAQQTVDLVRTKVLASAEISLVKGMQAVYHFIISIE